MVNNLNNLNELVVFSGGTAYQNGKVEPKQLSYNSFLKGVDAHFQTLKQDVYTQNPAKVAAKLRELAERKITQIQRSYSWMQKIADVFNQLFQGHGFTTSGDYGLNLAKRLEASVKEQGDQLDDQTLASQIRHLTGDQLRSLTPERKRQVVNILLQCPDWYSQLAKYNAIKEEILQNPAVVRKMRQGGLEVCQNPKLAQIDLFNELVAKAVKDAADKGEYSFIEDMAKNIHPQLDTSMNSILIEHYDLIGEEASNKINENVNLALNRFS